MRFDTQYEQVETTSTGYKFLTINSGRRVTFYDAENKVDSFVTSITRWLFRMGKLARDYDVDGVQWTEWDDIERRVDQLEALVEGWREELKKHKSRRTKEERIKQLRDVSGRTPEEAAAFLAKADKLEREL